MMLMLMLLLLETGAALWLRAYAVRMSR